MSATVPNSASVSHADTLMAGPPAGNRHISFLNDPVVDQLMRAVVTLTAELSVTRDRLNALELVLANQGNDVSAAIENLVIPPEADAQRRANRDHLVAAILGPIVEAVAASD